MTRPQWPCFSGCYCTSIYLVNSNLVLLMLLCMRSYSSLGRIAYASNRSGGLAVLCVLLLLVVLFYSDSSIERSTIMRSEDVKNDMATGDLQSTHSGTTPSLHIRLAWLRLALLSSYKGRHTFWMYMQLRDWLVRTLLVL